MVCDDCFGANHTQAYDGASPGANLPSLGGALFTPGLAQQDGNGQHFYQTDALGSVRGVSGNNQAPQGEVYYDGFGLPSVRQGSQPSPLGFAGAAGYQTDADTGLMLLGNRYYDPSIGRFLSPDPAKAGENWYAYCDNDPLTKTDPTGLLANGSEGRRDIGAFTDSLLADNAYSTSSVWDENAGPKTNAAKEAKAAAAQVASKLDSLFTFGTGGKLVAKYNAYRQGKASGGALISSIALFGLAAAANFIPGEEEANLAAHGAELLAAKGVDNALKMDFYHYAPTFFREEAARIGTHFRVTGNDGVTRTLTQMPGTLNGVSGRFEYLVGPKGLEHQLFVRNGRINGIPTTR